MLQREIRALTFKTKSFAAVEPNLKSLEYRARKLREEQDFEDSIFSCNDTRENTPDLTYRKITKIVYNFLEKLNLKEAKEVSKLTRYLTNVAVNYNQDQAEVVLPQVVTNLRKISPNIQISLKEITEFFAKFIGEFQSETDVNYSEVIKAIVSTAMEQKDAGQQHDPQNILIEIIQQLVNTLKAEDFFKNDCLSEVVKEIQKLPGNGMNSGLLDVEEIMELLDVDDVEINYRNLQSAVQFVVTQLVEN